MKLCMNRQTSSLLSILLERVQKIKKTDWLALALAGAILLIIAMPTSDTTGFVSNAQSLDGQNLSDEIVQTAGSQKESISKYSANEYVKELEERLQSVLVQMDGVGDVKVMITISDYGENVVEKDKKEHSNSTTEIENGNHTKTSVEQEFSEETIHVEDSDGSYPYVEKEILPTIEGVVVVAEGGGNPTVVSNISKAAMALFPIEAHKIIVVKMSGKGDSP